MTTLGKTKHVVRQSALSDDRARLLAGLAVEERWLDVGGIATSWLECGRGPAAGAAARRHRVRRRLLGAGDLSACPEQPTDHPDGPGLGESEPADRLDVAAFSRWFKALVELTCEDKPALVAHSLLGSMAARFAAGHNNLLDRLVLYSAPGVGRYRMRLRLRVVAILFALRPSEGSAERFDRWAFADYDRRRQQNREWLAAFNAYTRSLATVSHTKRTMRQLIGSCTKQVTDDELRRIDVPTALLWGRHDRFVSVELGEDASARLGWPLEVVRGRGARAPHRAATGFPACATRWTRFRWSGQRHC